MEIDIINIDKNIREKWKINKEKIKDIDKNINEINELLKDSKLSKHIITDLNDKLGELKKIKKENDDFYINLNFYIMDVTNILEKYKQKIIEPKKISFMTKRRNIDQNEVRIIVKEYLDILKNYNIDYDDLNDIVSNNNKIEIKKKECKICNSHDFLFNEYYNVEICEGCGSQEEKSYKSSCYKDISRVNISNKYTYERRVHFKDCINQYQGKQNSTIDYKVYKDIEEQLESHGLLNKEDENKRFVKVSKEHILLFLKETGHSKHYEDIVLIYHKLTGKKVDDISHIEDKLMEDFDKISNVYDQKFKFTGKIDRKSFINTQYVLFQLLRRHKYPCKREDFNMLKTLDRKSFHDDILKVIFEHLNFNFTPIF